MSFDQKKAWRTEDYTTSKDAFEPKILFKFMIPWKECSLR